MTQDVNTQNSEQPWVLNPDWDIDPETDSAIASVVEMAS